LKYPGSCFERPVILNGDGFAPLAHFAKCAGADLLCSTWIVFQQLLEAKLKATALGGDVIGKDQCQKLQDFIMSMETANDLGGLFDLTTAH